MERVRKKLPGLILLAVILAAAAGFAPGAVTVRAATYTNQLRAIKPTAAEKREGYKKRYVYYGADGKKVKNKWVTVNDNKMYFGSDRKAYQAPTVSGYKTNIVYKRIKKVVYCFDIYGRMVTGPVATAGVPSKTKYYYFDSTGVYDKDVTKQLRTSIRNGLKGDMTLLQDLLGSPKSTKRGLDVCVNFPGTTEPASSAEVWLYSWKFQVQVGVMDDGRKFIINAGVTPTN